MANAAIRRERRKHERREAILEAAARVLGEKGPHAATMDDVAEAAEVSKGTVYLYFPSKEDLFLALAHGPLDATLERFAALDVDGQSGLAALRRLVEVHQETTKEHASRMRVAIGAMCAGFDPSPDAPGLRDYGKRVQKLRATYLEVIRRGIADGSLRADLDPEEVAAGLWAAMFGAASSG
ncbi:MAG: TetR/AcrR family transcriptional regulator [Sandaracinaceae bacterium]|nr:TetR/AcrR family transcriptional regulator [Sandaracinaceae bacterium]